MPNLLARAGTNETKASVPIPDRKNKFRTVLGLSNTLSPHSTPLPNAPTSFNTKSSSHRGRRSVDVTSQNTYAVTFKKHKSRAERASITDSSFYEINTADLPQTPVTADSPTDTDNMPVLDAPAERFTTRRKAIRMDVLEGPWSVSVAETPYDKKTFNIYINTPTLYLTLTRSAAEIVQVHHKLATTHPEVKLPTLPLDERDMNGESPEKKRKSTFLHTLSRLASPGPNRRDRPKEAGKDSKSSSTAPSTRSSFVGNNFIPPLTLPTPLASPARDISDPFIEPPLSAGSSNTAVTSLAAYLTTLSNDQIVKHSKVWRRFVRIRTDDLQSERAERAVKRVRSDLALHLSRSGSASGSISMVLHNARPTMHSGSVEDLGTVVLGPEGTQMGPPSAKKKDMDMGQGTVLQDVEEEETKTAEADGSNTVEATATVDLTVAESQPDMQKTGTVSEIDVSKPVEETLPTPGSSPASAQVTTSRIPRSQSAGPVARMSRLYDETANGGEESTAEYESEVATELDGEGETEGLSSNMDEPSTASASSQRKRRKPRSRSRAKAPRLSDRKVVVDDFEMMRVLGKGCAGKVLLVRHKKTESVYALKAITKRHVLAHQELLHTLTEQAVLKRMAREGKDPFVVKLWWSFHDKENLFLVMDFHPGGDLATQLARWGRLGRDRARFYAAEIVEGVDGLHAAGVIYRDLKPENILIGADGHIVLTDFGLSKEFPVRASAITAPATPAGGGAGGDSYLSSSSSGSPQQSLPYWMSGSDAIDPWSNPLGHDDKTSTFCGTAEYLAPEVIQGLQYSYEVDWWSFGTMLYEMLTGITPFWANNHSDMYLRVLHDELKFPDDRAMDQDTKGLIRGLLQRNPALRLKQPRIKRHPYFSMIDWSHVYYKRYIPPYIPPIDPSNASDTQNFDDAFLDMEPVIDNEPDPTDDSEKGEDTDRTDGEDSVRTPAQSRSPSVHPEEPDVDLFDGYSFKGRHSVIIDDEEDSDHGGRASDSGSEDDDDLEAAAAVIGNLIPDLVEVSETPGDVTPEPRTPEQRKVALPDEISAIQGEQAIVEKPAEPTVPVDELSPQTPESPSAEPVTPLTPKNIDQEISSEAPERVPSPVIPNLPHIPKVNTSEKLVTAATRPMGPSKAPRKRREKSGIAALDRHIQDAIDEDAEDEGGEEPEEEEDDWDFVETPGHEDRNGTKGPSLFARGVVDRYKLAVFRKVSTPNNKAARRNFSGQSNDTDINGEEIGASPSSEKRRGRSAVLTFRRNPKQFLRGRSPTNSNTVPRPQETRRPLIHSASATISASTTSSTGLLTPSPSMGPGSGAGPSLKSKLSTTSMGSPGSSSDQSINGDRTSLSQTTAADTSFQASETSQRPSQTSFGEETDKSKARKLKKYKEGAEKVLSLFASPRP